MKQEFYNFFIDLNDDNIHRKVGELLDGIKGNYVTALQTEIMFGVHNRLFPNTKEHTKSCTACRGRVYNRLTEWYKNNLGN